MKWHGSLLALALGIAFRDRPVEFAVYDRSVFDQGYLNSLGPVAKRHRSTGTEPMS